MEYAGFMRSWTYLCCIGVGRLGVVVDGHGRQDDRLLVDVAAVVDDVAQHRFQHGRNSDESVRTNPLNFLQKNYCLSVFLSLSSDPMFCSVVKRTKLNEI